MECVAGWQESWQITPRGCRAPAKSAKCGRNREIGLLICSRTVPGDADQLRRGVPEGRADGSVFPAPTAALQSHPEQLAGSDALLAVTAPCDAPTVRHIPSWRAPEPLPGLSLQGRRRGLEGFGERLEPFALAAPQAGPGASCLPELGHCQVWRLRFQFIFFLARSEQPHVDSRARMQSVWAALGRAPC